MDPPVLFEVSDATNGGGDGSLDFGGFCAAVREQEDGDLTDDELRERFEFFDADGSGRIDMHEYVKFSLKAALSNSSNRVAQIFEEWDDDGSGTIDRLEFRKAVRAFGFGRGCDADIDKVFDEFDADGSGSIEYPELNRKLRQFSGIEAMNRTAIRRVAGGRKGAALSTRVKLDTAPGARPVADQMRDILTANAVRVIDLFHDWDDDGSGSIDRSEFRKALSVLGLDSTVVSRDDVDALFDSFDADGGGSIEYKELSALLKRRVDVAKERRRRKKRAKAGPSYAPAVTSKYGSTGTRSSSYQYTARGVSVASGMSPWAMSNASREVDASTNTWCLPHLDPSVRTPLKNATHAWMMPMKDGPRSWLKVASPDRGSRASLAMGAARLSHMRTDGLPMLLSHRGPHASKKHEPFHLKISETNP